MKQCEPNGGKAPRSIDQLTQKNVETVLRLEEATKSKATVADQISDFITTFCGSIWFVYFHVVWFGLWFLVNVVLPQTLSL